MTGLLGEGLRPVATAAGNAAAPHIVNAIVPAFLQDSKQTQATRAAVRLNSPPRELHWGLKAGAVAVGFLVAWGIIRNAGRAAQSGGHGKKKA